jgi:competence protein ComEA
MEKEATPETFLDKYRPFLVVGALGVILIVVGIRLLTSQGAGVEFIEEATASAPLKSHLKADIAGAVVEPGVYTLDSEARLQDLLVAAGGLASDADRVWVEKYVNLAARVIDGSKIYIPKSGEIVESPLNVLGSESSGNVININSASVEELDRLPGVGEVTAQKIISNRPYGTLEDLLTKKALNKGTFDKIKDQISLY